MNYDNCIPPDSPGYPGLPANGRDEAVEAGGQSYNEAVSSITSEYEFPEQFSKRWAFFTALAAGVITDQLLIGHARGINFLIISFLLAAVWIRPTARSKGIRTISALPTILFIAMSTAMSMQAAGPADAIFFPLWSCCLIYFAVSSRNHLLGLDNTAITDPLERFVALSGMVDRSTRKSRTSTKNAWPQIMLGVKLGMLPAVLLLFLFCTADAGFYTSLYRFSGNWGNLLNHFFWIASICCILFSWSGILALAKESGKPRTERDIPDTPVLSSTVALSMITAVTIYFVVVHLQTISLNESEIYKLLGVSYRTYIRKGFAELLVAEAVIGISILYFTHTKSWRMLSGRFNRALAWLLIALTVILSLSCFMRLSYYIAENGLSLVRSMNIAGIIISFACLALLGARLIKPSTILHTCSAIVKIFLITYVAWSCTFPVHVISSVNARKYIDGKPIEIEYLHYLGPDAWPAMKTILDSMQSRQPRRSDIGLLHKWHFEAVGYKDKSWFEWNPSVALGQRAVYRAELPKWMHAD